MGVLAAAIEALKNGNGAPVPIPLKVGCSLVFHRTRGCPYTMFGLYCSSQNPRYFISIHCCGPITATTVRLDPYYWNRPAKGAGGGAVKTFGILRRHRRANKGWEGTQQWLHGSPA